MDTITFIVGVVLAVVGIVLTLVSMRTKSPMYAVSGMNLVSSSIGKYGNLEIRYARKVVPEATVSHICFWNNGREAIRKDDIAPGDPITITVKSQGETTP